MKISSRSGRPTTERISCRWVPSAQSNRRRSPPRRTRTAVAARDAVGALPEVPRKTMSRSTRGRFSRRSRAGVAPLLRQDEALAGANVRTGQVIRLLDAPDRRADVAPVVPFGDRPEGVVRPHGHDLPGAVRLGRAGDRAPDEDREAD